MEKKRQIFKIIYKVLIVLLGTMFIGLGAALQKISKMGQDPLSAMSFSLVYLIDIEWISYSVCYIIVNLVFFIIMFFMLRKSINIGTLINFILTGVFCDLYLALFSILKIDLNNIVIQVIVGLLGIISVGFGVALYIGTNMGIAPFDAMPIIISKKVSKLKFKYAKILVDLCCIIIALVVGMLILKRTDIISINTILSLLILGPTISFFNKILLSTIYKNEKKVID